MHIFIHYLLYNLIVLISLHLFLAKYSLTHPKMKKEIVRRFYHWFTRGQRFEVADPEPAAIHQQPDDDPVADAAGGDHQHVPTLPNIGEEMSANNVPSGRFINTDHHRNLWQQQHVILENPCFI